ncbi:hypothetical protein GCM10027019_31390 [Melaminivora jejuensis]|uniref:hypothetical protein n=1 Tax=Melaminivora jejuensis TaxID=1267217 RepID=UPI001AE0C7B9|nr:hypothetical protein [Melaminivora jejuensis]UHJ63554.1 hypothetical protein LVC68_08850 [Melaminivora jejuensis]
MEYKIVQLTLNVMAPKGAEKDEITRLVVGALNDVRVEICDSKEDLSLGEVNFVDKIQGAFSGDCWSCDDLRQKLQVERLVSKNLAQSRRCLIIVSGGVADYVCDTGVDVEIFDWDNYKEDPVKTGLPPERFRDLADVAEIPEK